MVFSHSANRYATDHFMQDLLTPEKLKKEIKSYAKTFNFPFLDILK